MRSDVEAKVGQNSARKTNSNEIGFMEAICWLTEALRGLFYQAPVWARSTAIGENVDRAIEIYNPKFWRTAELNHK